MTTYGDMRGPELPRLHPVFPLELVSWVLNHDEQEVKKVAREAEPFGRGHHLTPGEPGSGVLATVSGELGFEKQGRKLLMVEPYRPAGPGQQLRMCFEAVVADYNSTPGVSSFTISPHPMEPRPVTPEVLRAVRLGEIAALTVQALRLRILLALQLYDDPRVMATTSQTFEGITDAMPKLPAEPSRGRRPRTNDDHLRSIAHLCIDLYRAGVRRGVYKAIAAQYKSDGDPVRPRTVEDWAHAARRKGFLAASKPGTVFFGPGPNL